jgi:hypothetical protein
MSRVQHASLPFLFFGFPKLSSCVSVTTVWLEFWSIVFVASLVFLCLLLFFGASVSSLFAPSLPHHSFTSKLFVAVSWLQLQVWFPPPPPPPALLWSFGSRLLPSFFCFALQFGLRWVSLFLLLMLLLWSFGFFPPSSFSSSPAFFLKSFFRGVLLGLILKGKVLPFSFKQLIRVPSSGDSKSLLGDCCFGSLVFFGAGERLVVQWCVLGKVLKVQIFLRLSFLVSRYTFPAAGAKLAPGPFGCHPKFLFACLFFFSPIFLVGWFAFGWGHCWSSTFQSHGISGKGLSNWGAKKHLRKLVALGF